MSYYKNQNSIGGYFQLETIQNSDYHPNALAVNTARNALEYIILAKNINKLYLPYFTCDVLLEPVIKLGISYKFYNIDNNLEPIFDYNFLKENEAFLYTNYFGLKDDFINKLVLQCNNLIIDNAQAFFAKPINKVATIYSARKFFGVADGAYLYCDKQLDQVFETDVSIERMSHLLIGKDISAESGYNHFLSNDKSLKNQPIKLMSKLTKSILQSIDYDKAAKIRIENFNTLHKILGNVNEFKLKSLNDSVPMVYPFWSKDLILRKRLLENKIYTATYWPNVKEWCKVGDFEYLITEEIVHLPIDQRYGKKEMEFIINLIQTTE
jgi:hypothetical protein